jgi:hypothetical protein
VAEWSIAAVLKTVEGHTSGGSNPSLSALLLKKPMKVGFFVFNNFLQMKKFLLSLHLLFSIGWLGAVAGFLALSLTGYFSKDIWVVKSSYISMNIIMKYVIVPTCIGSLISGIVQSATSNWGFFKYYWILAKMVLTVIITFLLLLHTSLISSLAYIATYDDLLQSDLSKERFQVIFDAFGAFLILIVIVCISVFKPWGKLNINKTLSLKAVIIVILIVVAGLLHHHFGGKH